MNSIIILFGILTIVAIIVLFLKCGKENYSVIQRYNFPLIDQNKCKYPTTNNKKYTTTQKALSDYGQQKIIQPNTYLEIVEKLMFQLSNKNIDIDDNELEEIIYDQDVSIIKNFIHSKINDKVTTEEYLQQNGSFKFEYLYPKDLKIYYFKYKNNEENNSSDTKIFKIIFTLYNPIRSVSVDCIAFISNINNNLNIEYANILNDWKHLNDNSEYINKIDDQKHIFKDSLVEQKYNKFAKSTAKNNLDYADVNCDELPVQIKSDIPDEYKGETVKIQNLPPTFGTGVIKYPPIYKNKDETYSYYKDGPLF